LKSGAIEAGQPATRKLRQLLGQRVSGGDRVFAVVAARCRAIQFAKWPGIPAVDGFVDQSMNALSSPPTPKPRRRWLQFSLRTLMLLVVMFGAGFGWLGMKLRQAKVQREAVDAVSHLRVSVSYDRTTSLVPDWLRTMLGDDVFAAVVWADFDDPQVTDADLRHLEGLPQLRTLHLTNAKVTDAGLEHVKGLTQLRHLNLFGTTVTDTGLAHIEGLTQLRYLRLTHTQVTDAGLEHLKGLTQLEDLTLVASQVTDAGLAHLEGLTQLRSLVLASTHVTDAGLEHLQALTQLTELHLDNAPVTDAGLVRLRGLTQLAELSLSGTKITDAGLQHVRRLPQLFRVYLRNTEVTDAGVAELQKAWPILIIER
jgi:hypothetical protein